MDAPERRAGDARAPFQPFARLVAFRLEADALQHRLVKPGQRVPIVRDDVRVRVANGHQSLRTSW